MKRYKMSTYIRKTLSLSLFIISVFVWISAVFGDGGLVIWDPDSARGRLQSMNRQLCAINYENGVENMLLSIYTSEIYGEKAAWIFPVPAEPEEITIDVVGDFPLLGSARFRGYKHEVGNKAKELIYHSFLSMRLSQLYTFPFFLQIMTKRHILGGFRGASDSIGVKVHKHIEKMGLTSELVTAETGTDLYNYLKNKSLELPLELQSVLDKYIGQKYSFVISWISGIEQFKAEARGTEARGIIEEEEIFYPLSISITFPTEKIYFPLKPTSVYGDTIIPITIYVIGHCSPEFSESIKPKSKITYFIKTNYFVPNQLSSFFNARKHFKRLNYSEIYINSPSNLFKEDLYINPSAPRHIKQINFIIDNIGLLALSLFALISSLASMLAGIIAFRGSKPYKAKFALLGLGNFLTLAGLTFLAHKLRIDTSFTQTPQKKEVLEKIGFWRSTKITAFIALASSALLCLGNIPFLGFRYYDLGEIFRNFPFVFGATFIFLLPLVYIFIIKNKQIRNFFILFSLTFLALTVACEFLCYGLVRLILGSS